MKSTDASVDGKVDCLVGGQQHTWYLSLWVGCIGWHKAVRWAKPKNGSKWWWKHWWRPGDCNLHIYCPSFETRQSGQYLLAPQRRPRPIGTNASGGVVLCCLSIGIVIVIVIRHPALMVEDRTVFELDWCLDLDLVSFYSIMRLKRCEISTAMSSVYVFHSCWTFSDWFSLYLMNSWTRANLSRSNRQRGVVAEYSLWTRLMRR